MIQSYGPRVVCIPQGTYDATKTYVTLDMVRYNNQNFIARTKVPENQPPTDGVDNEYWAFWGAYSQEVADLTQAIDDFANFVGQNLNKIEMRFCKNNTDIPSIAGNCFILKSESNKVYMFDLGYDFNLSNIVDSLTDLGVSHIDYLIISHYHADHANTPNLNSLYNMGYIDERTIVYTPRVPSGPAWTGTLPTLYADFMSALSVIGCPVLVPDNTTRIADENLEISFFNASASDYAYYDALSPATGYNTYSVCNYIEYHNLRIANLGDLTATGKSYIASLGNVKHCQITTAAHHGRSDYESSFDDVLKPDYVVIMCSAGNLLTLTHNNAELSYYSAIDAKLLPTNNYAVELNANSLFYDIYNGEVNYHAASLFPYYIYVDGNYTDDQNGTPSKPFSDIHKALAAARAMKNGVIRISCSNYTLSGDINICDIVNKVSIEGCNFTGGLPRFDDCNIEFHNCTFAGTNGIRLDNCHVYFDGCTFDAGSHGGYGIWARGSYISAGTITINDKNNAIQSHYGSNINIGTLAGADNTNVFNLSDSNSQVVVGTSTIAATNVFNSGSHCNVNQVNYSEVDLSSLLTAAVSIGSAKASISNGQVLFDISISNMTGAGLNTAIINNLPEVLRPSHELWLPLFANDTGYTSGTWYNAILRVSPTGVVYITSKDYASIKQAHITFAWTSALR